MRVETSNKKTKPSDQSNRIFAIGKRKGECYGLALSLQDVFSESENASGIRQKTSWPFENEQKNEAQLDGNM